MHDIVSLQPDVLVEVFGRAAQLANGWIWTYLIYEPAKVRAGPKKVRPFSSYAMRRGFLGPTCIRFEVDLGAAREIGKCHHRHEP